MKPFALSAVLVALSSAAFAEDLRSHILAADKMNSRLLEKKDMDGFVKFIKGEVTTDFKYTEGGKTMTFDEMAAELKMGMGAMTITHASEKILSLTEKGESATALMNHVVDGTTGDKAKKVHKIRSSGTSLDTYRKENGKWLMASMAWKDSMMTVDGKAAK
jgi:hypothetical protein